MQYSAIVPMYNENPRVLEVLTAINKCIKISEIICVDDGSTDGSGELVKERCEKVIVRRHRKNLGKLQAVLTGVSICSNENVLIMDSDLKNIIPEEIDRAIEVFEKNNIDCLLLCTKPTNMLDRIVRFFIRLPHIATGCRIIRKHLLVQSIAGSENFSYQLEPAQNKFLMENHSRVAYVNISAVGVLKAQKVGFLRGYTQEIKMWHQVLSYGSIGFNIRQAFLFARRGENI